MSKAAGCAGKGGYEFGDGECLSSVSGKGEFLAVQVAGDCECLESIAEKYGFSWQTIWNLRENRDLKAMRKHPNILKAGDRVFIPLKSLRQESCETDRKHRFIRHGIPSRFRIRLLSNKGPRAGLRYVCDVEGQTLSGCTDAEGNVTIIVHPGAREALLRVTENEETEEYRLRLGALDPVQEVSGLQQRLLNLGFECDVTGEIDEATAYAISAFRSAYGLPVCDETNKEFQAALLQAHGA